MTAAETALQAKARGAFYTPPAIASFLVDWAIIDKEARVLEPSCGDGAFLVAAADRLISLGATDAGSLVGVEKSPAEASKAAAYVPGAHVLQASFFDVQPYRLGGTFDAVVGNPPFIRYHGFTGEDRAKGLARAGEQGVPLTRLASSWAHFVIHASSFLSERGRLGLVLPAELLVTDYAQPVRTFLRERFPSVVVVAFDRFVFPSAQVDAVLLLASDDGPRGLSLLRLRDATELGSVDLSRVVPTSATGQRWATALDAGAETAYGALVGSRSMQRLAALASVDIGIVTGANAYFILSQREAEVAAIPSAHLASVIERPRDVRGLSVHETETARLLLLPPSGAPADAAVARYLELGVRLGIPTRYKCRVRRAWFSVPLPKKLPHAFLPYMTGDTPRLIVNDTGSWSTNLLHGVTLKPDAPDIRAISAAMLSSATLLSAEVEGRPYGGGVLKLETKEAERLVVPVLTNAQIATLVTLHPKLDRLVREGDVTSASLLVDDVLGIDSEALVVARAVFRRRRLERRMASSRDRSNLIPFPATPSD